MINYIKENNKKDSDIVGLIGNYEMIDYVSDGLIYYYKLLKALGDNAKIMTLDQQTIEKIRKFKVDSMKNGPSKFINKETEIELIRKVNARVAENKVSDSMKTKAKSEPSEEKGFWAKVIDLFK